MGTIAQFMLHLGVVRKLEFSSQSSLLSPNILIGKK